jgi:hypothetical protein
MKSRVLSFLALVLLAGPAHADTVYTYTGDYFGTYVALDGSGHSSPRVSGVYTTADRITGSFTVADGFVPVPIAGAEVLTPAVLRYSFTDGHQTLTEANSAGNFALGHGMWGIAVMTVTGGIQTELAYGQRFDAARLDADNWGVNSGGGVDPSDGSHVGTWTVTTVPEPMTLLLVVAGIGGIAAARVCLRIRP